MNSMLHSYVAIMTTTLHYSPDLEFGYAMLQRELGVTAHTKSRNQWTAIAHRCGVSTDTTYVVYQSGILQGVYWSECEAMARCATLNSSRKYSFGVVLKVLPSGEIIPRKPWL